MKNQNVLIFELNVMKTMGFGYFLIVQDFINAARENECRVEVRDVDRRQVR